MALRFQQCRHHSTTPKLLRTECYRVAGHVALISYHEFTIPQAQLLAPLSNNPIDLCRYQTEISAELTSQFSEPIYDSRLMILRGIKSNGNSHVVYPLLGHE